MIKEILSNSECVEKQLIKTFPEFKQQFPEELKLTLINMIKHDETVTVFPNTVEVQNSTFKQLVIKICKEWVIFITEELTEYTCFYRQANLDKLKSFIALHSEQTLVGELYAKC
ncbi:hypothetical protein AVP1_0043 [Aeromonas phage AVP1]|nr:hypothetical protein AVP1_0043 [Aeromonas phage AVP1]